MQRLRYGLIALCMLLCSVTSASADVSIGIGFPSVSIGINLPLFPELVPVPGYPVYYAPQVNGNYFFYDGMYWVYQNDNWYASSWYNGPWSLVDPVVVPLYILRVPVRYYRQPPVYFHGWQSNAPPRWGQHWGHGWEQRRGGWDKWKRSSAPRPAPLPVYQRQFSGDRYPRAVEQQQKLRSQQYRYQPRDKVVRQHLKQVEQRASAPAQRGKQEKPQTRSPKQQEIQRSTPPQHGAPAGSHAQPPQTPPRQRGPALHEQQRGPAPQVQPQQRTPAPQVQPQQRGPASHEQRQQPAPASHEKRQQPAPASHEKRQQPAAAPERGQHAPQGQIQRSQDKGESQRPDRGKGQDKDEGRGR